MFLVRPRGVNLTRAVKGNKKVVEGKTRNLGLPGRKRMSRAILAEAAIWFSLNGFSHTLFLYSFPYYCTEADLP